MVAVTCRWLLRRGYHALFAGSSRRSIGSVQRVGRWWCASVEAFDQVFGWQHGDSFEAAKSWCLAMLDEGVRHIELPRLLYRTDGSVEQVPQLEPLRTLHRSCEHLRTWLDRPAEFIHTHEVLIEAKCFGIVVFDQIGGIYLSIQQVAAAEPGAERAMEADVKTNLEMMADRVRATGRAESLSPRAFDLPVSFDVNRL